jgi:hypothetical protein
LFTDKLELGLFSAFVTTPSLALASLATHTTSGGDAMNTRWTTPLFAALLTLGLTAVPASAQTFTLTATLTGAEEPPAPGINTGAFGNATVVVNMRTREVTWVVNVFNLPSGVTAGHIHGGAIGTGGPTLVNFTVPTGASNDFAITGSAADTTFTLRPDQGLRSADDIFQAILGGNTYVNVHSAVNTGGEIRGQLNLKP